MPEHRETCPRTSDGRGVAYQPDIQRNTSRLFWCRAYNSYVISPGGPWLFGDQPVSLLSINGAGEIRWAVLPWEVESPPQAWESAERQGMRDAVAYFNLTTPEN